MDLLRDFLRRIDSGNTRRAYRADLHDYFDFLKLDSVTKEAVGQTTKSDVSAYIRSRRKEEMSTSTLRRRMSALRRFFDWLVNEGYVDRNPARTCQIDLSEIEVQDRSWENPRSLLSKSDVEALVEATGQAGEASVRDRGLILTILYGALRRAEVAAMNVEHVRPLGRHWVIDLPAGEVRSSAYVKIPKIVIDAIEKVQARYGIDEGPLWRSVSNRNHGERMTPDAIYKVVRRTGRRAGLGVVNVELLRQTGLHLALKAGASLQQVQLHARVQSVQSVERYADGQSEKGRLSESAADFVFLDV